MTAQKVTEWLIRNGIVQENEREIIEFGFQEGKWILLNIIIAVSFFLIKHLDWTRQRYLLAASLTGILIFLLAPVANASKSLDSMEIKIYKRKTRSILFLDLIIMGSAMLL